MKSIKQNSIKAWFLAARPKTLAASTTPVLIGASLAYADHYFQWEPAIYCFLFASLMQIAANFINDLFDFLKGSDSEGRLGPKRACTEGWITPKAMKVGIILCIAIACLFGCLLIPYGGWQLILIGLCCLIGAFFYTTGPYPLSYNGWGDVMVILFFGLIPVGGTYYVQTLQWSNEILLAGLISGLVVDTLMVVNNYRDREADARNGKRTIVVRFGEKFGRYFYLFLGIAAAVLALWFMLIRHTANGGLVPAVYFMLHCTTWQKMVKIHEGEKLNSILGESSRNMLFMGLLIAVWLIFQ